MLITRYGLRLNNKTFIRPFSITSIIKSHKGSFRTSEDQIDTNDITTDNNPYSPTLYDDKVFVLKPNNFFKTQLPDNYRLSYSPLYESPGAKYISLLKRLTISFGVLGIYGAKLFFQSDSFDDLYGYIVMATTSLPAILVQYKTRDYVTRIFRLYDKNKPQTLENLVNNEQLIMEKLNILGGTTFNELLTISNNKSLKLSPSKYRLLKPYSTWEEIDPETKRKRKYFVVDNIGGIKMDRVWGIIEKNSGINNGRSDY
ncbi:uncharacterized protein J8A68_001487 [[Candida] subhashii]|uniref:Uncharacterized protein n=1 Tax=[Candida] subhashii TaxID=561895 RepID=A0A8J5QNT4_9ASCO|nr:uncharacterized protein J8A68_001487 [[Candida] subhashii]KAG7664959.1 hypothetical protein J8A68_001487 [[Candida] subhashii]